MDTEGKTIRSLLKEQNDKELPLKKKKNKELFEFTLYTLFGFVL